MYVYVYLHVLDVYYIIHFIFSFSYFLFQIVGVMESYKISITQACLLIASGPAVTIRVSTPLAAPLPSSKMSINSHKELLHLALAPQEGLVIFNTKRCPPYPRTLEGLMEVALDTVDRGTAVKGTVVKGTADKGTVDRDSSLGRGMVEEVIICMVPVRW